MGDLKALVGISRYAWWEWELARDIQGRRRWERSRSLSRTLLPIVFLSLCIYHRWFHLSSVLILTDEAVSGSISFVSYPLQPNSLAAMCVLLDLEEFVFLITFRLSVSFNHTPPRGLIKSSRWEKCAGSLLDLRTELSGFPRFSMGMLTSSSYWALSLGRLLHGN